MPFYMLHHFHLVIVTLYNNISSLFIMEQFKKSEKGLEKTLFERLYQNTRRGFSTVHRKT